MFNELFKGFAKLIFEQLSSIIFQQVTHAFWFSKANLLFNGCDIK